VDVVCATNEEDPACLY